MSDGKSASNRNNGMKSSIADAIVERPDTGESCGAVADPSGAVVSFIESPIYETMLSQQALLLDWYDEPWAEEARETMGVAYLRELRATLQPFRMGVDLFELGVPEASVQDVESFVRRLREMPFAEFSYYVLGRLIPMKAGQLSIDPEGIRELIEDYGVYAHYLRRLTEQDWQLNGPHYQRRYAELIEEFWNRYFASRYANLEVQHSLSIAKNEAFVRENGITELYHLITGRDKMHLLSCEDHSLTQVSFIPVVNIAHPFLIYSGHQEITCLYHASRTPERIAELTEKEKQLIALSRALGDTTRFQIVKLLFQFHDALNGQNIADKVQLSKSVVSKHLQQLKDAGIVRETSPDKRNNIYSVDLSVLQEMSPGLLEVLRG